MDSEPSIEQLLGILRRRAGWVLLCFVLVAGVAYGYSKHQTKKYKATAAIAFNSNPLSQLVTGLPASSGSSSTLQAQQNSNVELVKGGNIAAKTASAIGHGLTESDVSNSISISGQSESSIVAVAATSRSATLAAVIANVYAGQFIKEQQSSNRQFLKSALALVNRELAGLTRVQRFGPDGLDLQERAHTLGLLVDLGYNNAQVAQEAAVSSSPVSPRTKRNTIIGAILGLLLGLSVALLLERLDRRIKSLTDLETTYQLPLLGAIPKSAGLARSTSRAAGVGPVLPPRDAEAFSLIHARLRFLNVKRDIRTIVIASPASSDGKTTIARHLAEAAAGLGSRVLLLEVDLRKPTLARHLGIPPGPGLSEVLIGAVGMTEATDSVDLREGAKGHTLDVLVAGAALPPNPGELLDSRAMGFVLEQAKSSYDLVIIDTPPLGSVSDAFPLLTKVDGVVIVGWIGSSKMDAAERLQQVLVGSGAPLLGVVANGSKAGVPSPYPAADKPTPAASATIAGSSQEIGSAAKT